MGLEVDRLSCSFPVRDFDPQRTLWDQSMTVAPGTPHAAETRSVMLDLEGGGQVYLSVKQIPERGLIGRLDFNPARIDNPDGWEGASPDRVRPTAELAWRRAADVVDAACGLRDVRVTRLDVNRDFKVDKPSFYVHGLRNIKRPYARKNGVWSSAAHGNAQTLHVGSGAGMARLYDKGEELLSKWKSGRAATERAEPPAPPALPSNVLRFEYQARSRQLQRIADIRNLDDVCDERLLGVLGRNRWQWSAMGVEVAVNDRVLEKVANAGLSPRLENAFLGHLWKLSAGVPSPMGSATAAKYNRLIRQLNIVLADVAPGSGMPGFLGRLDYESGEEVVRVA